MLKKPYSGMETAFVPRDVSGKTGYTLLDDLEKDAAWRTCERSGIIQIIEHFNLAYALQALSQIGLADVLRESKTGIDLREHSGLKQPLLERFMDYLEIHGVVQRDQDTPHRVVATAHGLDLLHECSLAQLGFYVEAYGGTLSEIPRLLTGEAVYGADFVRDGRALGEHCATLFRHFHTDTILKILQDRSVSSILDLGCGGGQFLVDAALKYAHLRGIGLDLSPDAIAFANALAEEHGVSDRIKFKVGDAFRSSEWPEECLECKVITAVGVLHEHFRSGEKAVIDLLNGLADHCRDGDRTFVLGEPEIRMDRQKSDSDLFLVHIFTAQGFPRTREAWLDVIDRSTFECRRVYTRPNAGPRFNFFQLIPERRKSP